MRTGLAVLGAAVASIGTEGTIELADEPKFTTLFDGKTLRGWKPQHTDRFFVRDGVLANDGGTGWARCARRSPTATSNSRPNTG